jgi:hypothetical protein
LRARSWTRNVALDAQQQDLVLVAIPAAQPDFVFAPHVVGDVSEAPKAKQISTSPHGIIWPCGFAFAVNRMGHAAAFAAAGVFRSALRHSAAASAVMMFFVPIFLIFGPRPDFHSSYSQDREMR